MAFTGLSHIRYTKCPFCDALLEKLQNIPCTIVHQMTKLFLVAYSARNTVKVGSLRHRSRQAIVYYKSNGILCRLSICCCFQPVQEWGSATGTIYTKPRLGESEHESFENCLCVSSLLRSFIKKIVLCHFAHSNGEANPTTAYAITLIAILPHLDIL
jgi:hypothetical protein